MTLDGLTKNEPVCDCLRGLWQRGTESRRSSADPAGKNRLQTVCLGQLHRHGLGRRFLAMDTMTIGFLVGVVASTISVFLMVQFTGEKRGIPQRIVKPRKLQLAKSSSTRRPTRTKTKTKKAKPKAFRKLQVKIKPRPAEVTFETPSVSPVSLVSACPSCGLQAPETLMAEHFMQSPSHQYGPIQLPTTIVNANTEESVPVEVDPKNALRSLLQMLVPPRAFGRRHAHRTVSPLSTIVETVRDSSHPTFRP